MNTRSALGLILLLAGVLLFIGLQSTAESVPGQAARDREAWLGVYFQELNDAMRKALDIDSDSGVLISDVAEDSPAAKAGLDVGDVIVGFDGRPVYDGDDLRRGVERTDPGEKVDVNIVRDGKRQTLTVEMGERPRSSGRVYGRVMENPRPFMFTFGGGARLGVELAQLEPDLASYFDVKEGALILDVVENSPAEKAGLHAGDVIVAIEGDAIRDPEDVYETLQDLREGDKIEIEIVRHGKRQKIPAELGRASRRYRYRSGDDDNGLFYFFGVPGLHGKDSPGWRWDWDWNRRWPGGEGFLRIYPFRHGEDGEVSVPIPEAPKLPSAVLPPRTVL